MNKSTPLVKKQCQPCEGIGDPLDQNQANDLLKSVEGWSIEKDGKHISKKYIAKNFMAAVNFIQKVAVIAEAEDHHPDIHLTGYRKLEIDLSTHAIGGLSENDFIVAAKINDLPIELKDN